MKPRTLVVLTVITAAVVAIAAIVARDDVGPGTSADARPLLFQPLADRLNDAARLIVERDGQSFTIERTGDGDDATWGIAEKGGYPADFDTVRSVILALASMRAVEPKTSDPELYARIGVQDPGAPSEPPSTDDPFALPPRSPALVRVLDAEEHELAAAIIGHTKPGQTPQVYMRKPGEARSWLAETGGARLDLPSTLAGWIRAEVLAITRDRIRSATVKHPDGEVVEVGRDSSSQTNFDVRNIPAGRELKYSSIGNTIGNAITSVRADDVAPATEIDFTGERDGTPGAAAEFLTFDGLAIRVETTDVDGKTWARFSASAQPAAITSTSDEEADADTDKTPADTDEAPSENGASTPESDEAAAENEEPASDAEAADDAEAVRKEAEELNARLGPWAFALPSYQATNLRQRLEGLLKPAPAPSEADEAAEPTPSSPPSDAAPESTPAKEQADDSAEESAEEG